MQESIKLTQKEQFLEDPSVIMKILDPSVLEVTAVSGTRVEGLYKAVYTSRPKSLQIGKKTFSMARSLPMENLLPQNVGSIINYLTTCSNVLKQPNGELLVAVNHNQLRTMASETVDPIDWL